MNQEVTTINLGQSLTHTNVMLYRDMIAKYSEQSSLTINCFELKTIDGDGVALLTDLFMAFNKARRHLHIINLRDQPLAMFKVLEVDTFLKE